MISAIRIAYPQKNVKVFTPFFLSFFLYLWYNVRSIEKEYEKVKAVYTWLGETTNYSTLMTRKSGTAWSALLSDDSVCAGFAAASQLLFQRLGVESQVVVGSWDGVGHAWNFVKVDNEYYWYDSTVAGGSSKDSGYFYTGLLFSNNSNYAVSVLDMNKYQFGTKYIGG